MKRPERTFGMTVLACAAMLTVLFAAAAVIPCASAIAGALKKEKEAAVYDPLADGSVLRLHVVANSDAERDQRIKLAVRDAVLDYERAAGTASGSFAAESALLKDGSGLLKAVEAELREQGADYGAQLILGDFDFPDREYGGVLYPAGSYRALRILLGEAKGRNWWCILFPPLCLTETDGGAETTEQPIRFESLFVKLLRLLTGADRDEEKQPLKTQLNKEK